MKRILIFCSIFCFSLPFLCQKELGFNFNSCHSGRSINLVFANQFQNQLKLSTGLLINIGQIAQPDEKSCFHRKRLFPQKAYEYLGLDFSLSHYLTEQKRLFAFANVQLKYSGVRNQEIIKVYYDSVNQLQFYDREVNFYGPFFWMQNTVGLGFDVNILKSLYLSQKLGFGFEYIHGKDEKYLTSKRNWFEPAFIYNVGLYWRMNEKELSKSHNL